MSYSIAQYREKIQDIKDSPDLSDAEKTKFIGKVEELIKDLEAKETSKAKPKAQVKKKAPKMKSSQAKQARHLPMVVRTPQHAKDKEVKANDLESEYALTFITAFLRMIGKQKERKHLQSLLNRINKAADNKEIRKKSIHAEALTYVGESLVAALNTNYSKFTFKLDKIGSEVLEPYMNSKQSLPIRLLRQFYQAQNKKFSDKYAKLLTSLKKVTDKDNPYSIEIAQAIKTLEKAKPNGVIQATKPTLRGLEGICAGHKNHPIKDKRCRAIMASVRSRVFDNVAKAMVESKKKGKGLNGINPVVAGTIAGAVGGMIGAATQRALSGVELMEVDYDTMDLSFDFKGIGLDDMPKNASLLVYGKPKNGKSTFCLQLANELSKKGKLLYVSNEQMLSDGTPTKSLQDLVKRVGFTYNMFFAKDLSVDVQDYDFVMIDSINTLGLDIHAWRQLRERYPQKFFVLVSQVTKSGVFRGSEEWAHDVDVLVEVVKGKANVLGRFGTGEYQIFEEENEQNPIF